MVSIRKESRLELERRLRTFPPNRDIRRYMAADEDRLPIRDIQSIFLPDDTVACKSRARELSTWDRARYSYHKDVARIATQRAAEAQAKKDERRRVVTDRSNRRKQEKIDALEAEQITADMNLEERAIQHIIMVMTRLGSTERKRTSRANDPYRPPYGAKDLRSYQLALIKLGHHIRMHRERRLQSLAMLELERRQHNRMIQIESDLQLEILELDQKL
jgi:hypothetical protein